MKRKTNFILVLALAFALCVSASVALFLTEKKGASAETENTLIYKLDFSDTENRGKNSASTDYAAATFVGNAAYTENAVKGKTAISLPGGGARTNYFKASPEVLKRSSLTIAFWAKIPSNRTTWGRMFELYNGLGGTENCAVFSVMPYAPNWYNGLHIYSLKNNARYGGDYENIIHEGGDPLASNNTPQRANILPVYDAWTHYAYEFTPNFMRIYQNGYLIIEKEVDFTASTYYAESANVTFGATTLAWDHTADMNMSYADIRFYDGALSAEQLKSEYDLKYTDFLTASYDFENGTNDPVRGYNGTLCNTASIVQDDEKGNVLFVDGKQGGSDKATRSAMTVPLNTLQGHDEITISLDLYIDSNSGAYARVFEFAPRALQVLSLGGKWGGGTMLFLKYTNYNDKNNQTISTNTPFNTWANIAFTAKPGYGAMYINGYKVAENTSFNYKNSLFWEGSGDMSFGRTIFWGDQPITGKYDNIKIYSVALTDKEVMKDLGIITIDDDNEAVASECGKLTVNYVSGAAKVELPAYAGEGVKVEWASSNTELLAADGTIIPGAFNETVTLTATLTRGEASMTKTFELEIPAKEFKDMSLYKGADISETSFEEGSYYEGLMATNLDFMMSLDKERLLYNYRLVAGLDTRGAESYGAWISTASGGAGQFEAHYVIALAKAAVTMPDYSYNGETVAERLNYMFTEMAKCQKAYAENNPSEAGYFGAITVDHFYALLEGRSTTKDGARVWVPWYFAHKELEMLIDVYTYAEDETVKAEAYRMMVENADWCYNFTSGIDENTRLNVLKREYGGIGETLYQVYMLTGSVNHYKAAKFFEEGDFLNYIHDGVDLLNGLHSNTGIPKFLAAAAAYEATGDEYYKTVVENAFDMIMTRTYAFGGTSRGEFWQNAGELHTHNETCETCCSYNMLKLADYLYRWTGDKKYADYFELTYTNHILASMAPDSGLKTYHTNTAFGYYKIYHTIDQSFWCCASTGMESFAKLNYGIYYAGENAIRVNMFYPSTYRYSENFALTQSGNFYYDGKTTLTVSGNAATTVSLRLPDWADAEKVTLKLNGNALNLAPVDGYYDITREFTDGDVIEYEIAFDYALDILKGSEKTYALKYGPLVLVADLGTENVRDVQGSQLTFGTAYTGGISDKIVLDGTLDNAASATLTGGQLYVTLKTLNQGEITFRPFNQLFHNRYGMYFEYYDSIEEITADYLVEGNEYLNNFDTELNLVDMEAYSITGSGVKVENGKLLTSDNTELKLLYSKQLNAPYVVELILASAKNNGAINAGLYLLASDAANGQDMIKAYNIQIEKKAGQGVYDISVFKFYSRYIGKLASATLSMPENGTVKLHVTVKESKIFVYVGENINAVLSFDIEDEFVGKAGKVGIRSQFSAIEIESFRIISAELAVGKQSLESTIALANDVNADEYTPATATAFTEALNAAKAVAQEENATQSEINEADNALRYSMSLLIKRGDVTLLMKAYATFTALDKSVFTDESAERLIAVLSEIAALNEGVSEEEVNAATEKLSAALLNLELKDAPETPVDGNDSTDTEQTSSGKRAKGGCRSSVPAACGLIALGSALAALLIRKKREA